MRRPIDVDLDRRVKGARENGRPFAKRASRMAIGVLARARAFAVRSSVVIALALTLAWAMANKRRARARAHAHANANANANANAREEATEDARLATTRARAKSKTDGTKRDERVGIGTVTVILATNRASAEAKENWRAQARTTYDGDVEFIFVVESAKSDARDACVEVIVGEFGASGRTSANGRSARVVEAGRATTSSQKIHNMLAGVRAMRTDSVWTLFLDDDVETRPGTIDCLARALAGDSDAFLVTGYPFDVPCSRDAKAPTTANLVTYMYATYHLVLIIAFSQGRVTKNVWGGCVMLRADDLRRDAYGCVSAYANGGYSDDLILASIADRENKRVLCPTTAVFPSYMPDAASFGAWWNYMRRQMFVLDTYADAHNRAVNHALLLAIVVTSCAFSTGLALALYDIGAYVVRAEFASVAIDYTAVAAVTCFIFAMSSARAMYFTLGRVCESDGDYAVASRAIARISWVKMTFAFAFAYALVPVVAVLALVSNRIVWGDATYVKRRGAVRRVR